MREDQHLRDVLDKFPDLFRDMTDREVADHFMAKAGATEDVERMTNGELFELTVEADFENLTPAQVRQYDRLLLLNDNIDISTGSRARAQIVAMFADKPRSLGSFNAKATVASTLARSEKLRGRVREGDVKRARSL